MLNYCMGGLDSVESLTSIFKKSTIIELETTVWALWYSYIAITHEKILIFL